MDGSIIAAAIGSCITIVGSALGVSYKLGQLARKVEEATTSCGKIEKKQEDTQKELRDVGTRVTALEVTTDFGAKELAKLRTAINGK